MKPQFHIHRYLFIVLLSMGFLPSNALAFEFNPNFILSDSELTNPFSMDVNQIQSFLDRGYLAHYITPDHEGTLRSAADIIWRASQINSINPRFLLVLLQKEQSLVEDDNPTQSQLDWATGYAVCDACSKDDPALERWKGFGKQVNSASLQFIEGYMTDIALYGSTQGTYGPGIPVEIDGEMVTPQNAATAALYAYTPHLHGNQNFATIWNRWFNVTYPTGTLLKDATGPGVYRIEYGYKRPIHSWSALLSRFNPNLIIEVPPSVLANYQDGRAIDFPNYSLLKDEDGHIYLLVDDALRHIDSMETFRAIGFSEDEIVDIDTSDAALFDVGTPITLSTAAPQGKLFELPTGTIFYVQDGVRHVIFDRAVLAAHFPGAKPIATASQTIENYREGAALLMPDGFLVKSTTDATVYVISEGVKRAISSEAAFLGLGFEWGDIVIVSDELLALHPAGDAIEAP